MNITLNTTLGTVTRRSALLLAAILAPCLLARADIVGPYTPDASTLYLFHFDESAGSSNTVNAGSKGGNCITVTNTTSGNGLSVPPPSTNMLGKTGFNDGVKNFGNCVSGTNTVDPTVNVTINGLVGYDGNGNGLYDADVQGVASADAIVLTNMNIGNTNVAPTGNSPFTIEAMVNPTSIGGGINQEVVCTDDSNGPRGFQFRINNNAQLEFNFIGAPTSGSKTAAIPTTGPHAYVAGNWYHVAVTYDGTNLLLYWTLVSSNSTACNQIGGPFAWTSTTNGVAARPFVIGDENRTAAGECFRGLIDEVRISKVCRNASQMMFVSPAVTIVKQPSSQSIDYFQPVTFTVTASSTTPVGYQWRFNGTPIPSINATSNSYPIASVDLGNAGSYDVVITNTAGYAATSSPALLVVGSDHFLAHRWSFDSDASDSVGGANGTTNGNATISGGALNLDGTAGTYMSLPPFLIHNSNYTAVTFEFWANYNTLASGDNDRIFDFGNTNFLNAFVLPPENYVYFSPHSGANHTLGFSPTTSESQISAVAPGNLDGQTAYYVACVVDPPNHTMAIYTNGFLETNVTISAGLDSVLDEKCWIGRSLFTADAYFNGSIDELRMYSGALSPASIAQSFFQGPNTPLNAGPVAIIVQPSNTVAAVNLPASIIAALVGRAPISMQWYENGVAIPGATNPIYSFTAALSQDGHTFQLLATNTVTGTNYNVASSNAVLTVRIPLNLTWAGTGGNWDTASLNWTTNGNTSQVPYTEADNATFDTLGIAQSTVTLTANLHPSSVTVNGASYTLTGPGSITGFAPLIKSGAGTLIIDTTNSYTGTNAITGGTLQLGDGSTTGTLGTNTVLNNGAIVASPGGAATLSFPSSISGSGTFTLNTLAGGAVLSASNSYSAGTTVTAGILHARNASALGSGSTVVASGGEIYLDLGTPFDLNPAALTLNGSGVSGAGALRKGGANTTSFGGAITLGSDTTLNVDGGATLNLTNSSGLDGASANANLTLAGSGAGNITGPLSLGTGGLTVSGGTWTMGSAANSYSGKTFLNGGTLVVSAPGGLGTAPGLFTADQISMGNATTGGTLRTATSFALDDGLRGITVNVPTTTTVGFSVISNATLVISNPVAGGGVITKSGNGTLVLNGNNSFAGTLNTDGNSISANDGITRIASPTAFGNITIIQFRNNNAGFSTLQLDGSGGALTVSPVDIEWAGRNNNVPAIENVVGNNTLSPTQFTWNGGGGTYMIQSDADTLTVPVNIPNTAAAGSRALVLSGNGNIVVSGAVQDGGATNSIRKTGSGVATLTAVNVNSGTNIVSGGSLLVDGTLGAGLAIADFGGSLGGTGVISGPVTVSPGGALAPGDLGVGMLTLSSNLTIAGNVIIAVNRSLNPSNSMATVTGGITNIGSGSVIVSNLGPALAVGNSFTLFNQPVVNGGGMGVVGAGATWNNNLAVDGSISVASLTVPVPSITNIVQNGSNLIISGKNGYASGGFYVLGSTNLATPLANWSRVGTNIFQGNAFTFTNAMTPGAPLSFYIIQLQ